MFKRIDKTAWSFHLDGARAVAVAAALVCGAAVLPGAQAGALCSVEDARYTLKEDPAYTANFVGIKLDAGATNQSPVALHVHSTKAGVDGATDFWLGIEQGNGYSYAQLYVIADPALHGGAAVALDGRPSDTRIAGMAPMPLLIVSWRMEISADAPSKPSDRAPEQFMVPYLGSNLWYEGRHFSDQFNESNRERMPLGFFELSACARPAQ